MNVHDNGPRDGDFVRYIDELNAKVAASTAATTAATTTASARAAAAPRPRAAGPVAIPNSAPVAPAFAIATLGVARLFTIGLFVVGGIAAVIGLLASGLQFFLAVGIAMLAWASRREIDARKAKA